MPNDKPERPADKAGETDSLSATGMFLRAFGDNPKAEAAPSDPLFGPPATKPAQTSNERPAQQSGPGEFTQIFQNLDAKPVAPAVPAAEPQNRHSTATFRPSSPTPAEPSNRTATSASSGLGSGPGSGPGDFTRVFVGGGNQAPAHSQRPSEDFAKPASAAPAGGARGFSSPGSSGAASGEGSFTQIFSASPARPSSSPPEPPVPSPPRNAEWNSDPYFRSSTNPAPPESSPSVTSLLSSLGTQGGSAASGRPTEPVPYRPEPTPRSAPLFSQESPVADTGGVTQLIQRLAQTPVEPQAPAPAAPPPVNSGPGEFTRIISRMSAPAAEPGAPAPPAAATPPPPSFAMPHAPAIPAVAPPAMPHGAPPATPKFAPPPPPVVPMPPAPKPPAIAAPAIAPPKSKLEAMVPILLVINTFLLLILLIVVIFLIKSK